MIYLLNNTFLKLFIIGICLVLYLHYRFGFWNIFNILTTYFTGRYIGKRTHHVRDSDLLELIKNYKRDQYHKVFEQLDGFNQTYRDFGIQAIADFRGLEVLDDLLKSDTYTKSENLYQRNILLIIKGFTQVTIATDFISTIYPDSPTYEEDEYIILTYLEEAQEAFEEALKNSCSYDLNKITGLLSVFKHLNFEGKEREQIHDVFNKGLRINSDNLGLHIAYFECISLRSGGLEEEFKYYIDYVPNEQKLLRTIIFAYFYMDQLFHYGKDDDGTIKTFLEQADNIAKQQTSLYRYFLYVSIYSLSAYLRLNYLSDKYKRLSAPFVKL